MKIINPENKWNIIPKFFSIFPLFIGIALLANGEHLILKILSILFISLAIYTFFFMRYEKYLDTDRKEVVKRVKWLFINTNNIESLKNFESISISLGGTLPNSSSPNIKTKIYFDVVLIRKYASSKTHTGFGSLENFLLKTTLDINEAVFFAKQVGELVSFPVLSESELVKFLTYDPVETTGF